MRLLPSCVAFSSCEAYESAEQFWADSGRHCIVRKEADGPKGPKGAGGVIGGDLAALVEAAFAGGGKVYKWTVGAVSTPAASDGEGSPQLPKLERRLRSLFEMTFANQSPPTPPTVPLQAPPTQAAVMPGASTPPPAPPAESAVESRAMNLNKARAPVVK